MGKQIYTHYWYFAHLNNDENQSILNTALWYFAHLNNGKPAIYSLLGCGILLIWTMGKQPQSAPVVAFCRSKHWENNYTTNRCVVFYSSIQWENYFTRYTDMWYCAPQNYIRHQWVVFCTPKKLNVKTTLYGTGTGLCSFTRTQNGKQMNSLSSWLGKKILAFRRMVYVHSGRIIIFLVGVSLIVVKGLKYWRNLSKFPTGVLSIVCLEVPCHNITCNKVMNLSILMKCFWRCHSCPQIYHQCI